MPQVSFRVGVPGQVSEYKVDELGRIYFGDIFVNRCDRTTAYEPNSVQAHAQRVLKKHWPISVKNPGLVVITGGRPG